MALISPMPILQLPSGGRTGRRGEDGTYCPVKKGTMTAAERDTLKKRIAEARARREAEEERRHAKAAETAATRWSEASDAPDSHPYLERKMVRSYGLRLWGNQLLIPLHDEAGKLVSLQSIDPDGEKRFLAGGKTRGGAFFIPARDGKTATVLIAEATPQPHPRAWRRAMRRLWLSMRETSCL